MTWLVLLRERAEQDLASACDWYDSRQSGLGKEFLDEVAASLRTLESYPKRQHLYYRDFRRIIIRRFPYKIFYQIIGEKVIVFRILHARQDHGKQV